MKKKKPCEKWPKEMKRQGDIYIGVCDCGRTLRYPAGRMAVKNMKAHGVKKIT
jgi:hypothetical protein